MSQHANLPTSFRILLRRFGRNRRGSAAIQFAFVAPLFFGLLFAIIEVALIFLAGQVLETITQSSALFTCSNIYIDVESYSSFQTVTINSQIDGSRNFINNMKYCPGNSGDIVVVRLFYQWPAFVTGLSFNFSNLSGNMVLLSATAAFKNEPFVATASAC